MQHLLLALALFGQDPAPKPPPLPGAKESPAPVAAPLEKPLVPGAIPASAGPEERGLWQQLCRAALPPNAARVPLTGFDLVLDAQVRNATNQSNEAQALRYRFQVPDRVRATTEHGKELVHGPKGDFILDPAQNLVLPLAVGREGEQDRKQLAEIQDLARNFLALSDPAALRIAELKLAAAVDVQTLPPNLRAAASSLVWIEVLSPDFRLQKATGMVRVKLGLRRDKSLPDLCLVGPDKPGPGAPATTLIQALDYREKQGLIVPQHLALYVFDEAGKSFQAQPALEVWLKRESDLRPTFEPAVFEPKAR